MNGIDFDAARQLTVAVSRLAQLESDQRVQSHKLESLQSSVQNKRDTLAKLKKAKEAHLLQHLSLLDALNVLNQRNHTLEVDVRTLRGFELLEAQRLNAVVDEQLATQQATQEAAMELHSLKAMLEQEECLAESRVAELRQSAEALSQADQRARQCSAEGNRLRVVSDRMQHTSEYVERVLRPQ